MSSLYLSDAEVDGMTEGLAQDAAKIRFLRRLGLRVDRKPNGKPLVWRPKETEPAEVQNDPAPDADSVVIGLEAWAAGRKARHGQKTQGR